MRAWINGVKTHEFTTVNREPSDRNNENPKYVSEELGHSSIQVATDIDGISSRAGTEKQWTGWGKTQAKP